MFLKIKHIKRCLLVWGWVGGVGLVGGCGGGISSVAVITMVALSK